MDTSSVSDPPVAARTTGKAAKTVALSAVCAALIAAAFTAQFHASHVAASHHHFTLSYVSRISH